MPESCPHYERCVREGCLELCNRELSAAKVRVCLACGKVRGEHRGWDVSCEINSQEFDPTLLIRGENGLVKEIRDAA